MIYLLIVSLLWAFSFGLIERLLGGIDPVLLAFLRLSLSLVVFLPFLRIRGIPWRTVASLAAIGAVQYGAMYVLLFSAYPHIGQQSYLIALFTLTTPIFVLIFASMLEQRALLRGWLAAALAVAGAAVIQWRSGLDGGFWRAFVLLQFSNAAFAFGQIGYRRIRDRMREQHPTIRDRDVFAWVFLGAVVLTGLAAILEADWHHLSRLGPEQWLGLIYLGTVASGLAFFWWNRGATMVQPPTLAVLNNLKVPLAVLVSLVIFQEWRGVAWPQFLAGSAIMAVAFWLTTDK